MSARSSLETRPGLFTRRRVLLALLLVPVVAMLGLAGVSWWLTEPLEDHGVRGSGPPVAAAPAEAAVVAAAPEKAQGPPPWPEARVEGALAKQVLLESLQAVAERLGRVKSYTALFRKQERISGTLGPEQTMQMKVRHRPFAIYFKFLAPIAEKEVVYAEGHHDNKVIAHTGGVAGWLIPRLAVPPAHPLAMADNRHAVTEAGLVNLTTKLIHFRQMDQLDPEAVTILDRTTGADGRPWLRSLHYHPHKAGDRPFSRTEVLYDPDTRIPLQISNFDWPEPGQKGDLLLAERYAYENLNLDAELTALDFDPANPEYAFHR